MPTVWPIPRNTQTEVIAYSEMTRISHVAWGRGRYMICNTADQSVRMDAQYLTLDRHEILRLIALRIEARGGHLEKVPKKVLGPGGERWVVQTGPTFE